MIEEKQAVTDTDAEKLKFYLKNKRNRDMYLDQIAELTLKSPRLMTLYHQEMGKAHARHYIKEFKKIGLKPGWFVILQGLIIASGSTREEALKSMKKVTPVDKIHWVTLFEFKG